MNQKMRNKVVLTVTGGILSTFTDIVVDIKQGDLLLEYEPIIVDDAHAYFIVTKEQASQLDYNRPVRVQMLYTDADGEPQMTAIGDLEVEEMLRSEPYGD